MVPGSIFGQQQGLGAQAHGTLVPPNNTKFLIVLVELELARDARGGNLDDHIYDARNCKAIAYLSLCASNKDVRHRLSFSFAYSPNVCEILDADWEMHRNAQRFGPLSLVNAQSICPAVVAAAAAASVPIAPLHAAALAANSCYHCSHYLLRSLVQTRR
jgi:hypothetical protein